MKTVDIIVPVMNEEEVLNLFYYEVRNVTEQIKDYKCSLIFVDDGSTDKTLPMLEELAAKDRGVKYISFSRNFGKEAAIFAGLSSSTADRVILMDGDLEHPPALIPTMLAAVDEEGYDACGAKRETGFSSRMFANLNNKLSNVKLQKGATDYMCMSRLFVDAVLKLTETQRFTKGLFAWVGFSVKWLDYEQPVRPGGTSKWNLRKLFNYAADGITSFSTKPLRLVTLLGVIVCLLAFIYIIITLIHTLITGIEVPGYVTTLVVMLFLGGIIILSVGILGEYIGRIYLESKNRPLYITKKTNIGKAWKPQQRKRAESKPAVPQEERKDPAESKPSKILAESKPSQIPAESKPSPIPGELTATEINPRESIPAKKNYRNRKPYYRNNRNKKHYNNNKSNKADQNE